MFTNDLSTTGALARWAAQIGRSARDHARPDLAAVLERRLNMYWADLLFLLFGAMLLSSLLAWGFRWRHPARGSRLGVSLLFLFLVLLFAMWSGGLWLDTVRVPWLDALGVRFLAVGLFVSLILLAAARRPAGRMRSPEKAVEEEEKEAEMQSAFGIFFWILLVAMIAAIGIYYVL